MLTSVAATSGASVDSEPASAAKPTATIDSPRCMGSPAKRSAARSSFGVIVGGCVRHPSGEVRAHAPNAPAHSPIARNATGPFATRTNSAASIESVTGCVPSHSKNPRREAGASTIRVSRAMHMTLPASLDAKQSGRGALAGATAMVPPATSPSPK